MTVEENNIIKQLRLSVSKVKCFDSCKKKFWYNYVMHYPKKTWAFHTLGKFVHLALEEFHFVYLNGSDDPLHIAMGRAYKKAMKEFGKSMSEDSKKEAYEIIDGYLKKITNEKHTLKDVLAVEKNFSFPITKNIILNGMIDKVIIDNGILHISDYKTTKQKKYLLNDWLQLQTYAYIMLQENPDVKKIRGSYIMLRHNFELIQKDFEIDEILQIKEKFEDYAKQIEDEQSYEATPSRLCEYCDFLDMCEPGKEFLNKNTKNTNTGSTTQFWPLVTTGTRFVSEIQTGGDARPEAVCSVKPAG